MSNILETVSNMASKERFYYYDTHMFMQYGAYWPNNNELRTVKKALPVIEIRESVLAKAELITKEFSKVLLDKYYSYEAKRKNIPFANPLEKIINERAMRNMSAIYGVSFMNPMLDEIARIKKILPSVKAHYDQFLDLLKNEKTKAEATDLIKDMHRVRRELNKDLFSLSLLSKELLDKKQEMDEKGQKIGPAFRANPVIFLTGAPMMLKKESGLVGISKEEAIQKIEEIKQIKSVVLGVEPFYLLFLASIQSLRHMEQGMARCLGDAYKVDSGFNSNFQLKNDPDPDLISNKSSSLKSYQMESDIPILDILPIQIDDDSKMDLEEVTNEGTAGSSSSSSASGVRAVVREPTKEEKYLALIQAHLTCPMAKTLIVSPVIGQVGEEKGVSFEESAIGAKIRKERNISAKDSLPPGTIIINYTLKSFITRFTGCKPENLLKFLEEIPEFESSISLDLFNKPTVVSSGMTFDLEEVNQLYNENKKCPLTNLTLDQTVKIENKNLAALMATIKEIKEKEKALRLADIRSQKQPDDKPKDPEPVFKLMTHYRFREFNEIPENLLTMAANIAKGSRENQIKLQIGNIICIYDKAKDQLYDAEQ